MQKILKVDKDNVIIVSGKGCVHGVSSIDGEVLWTKDLAAERLVWCFISQTVSLSSTCWTSECH